jgi:ABC-type uncharacterized transport system permease subunit
MANIYNAGQLAAIITQLSEMDVEDLGTNPNTFIYTYMNIAMMKLARVAYQVKFSDALQISSNGPVTFQTAGVDISDLYEPQSIYTSTDSEIAKRTSYAAPVGWWREAENQPIHVRGLPSGLYTLKYIKYPARVSIETDPVEFPPSGYDALIKEVVSLIKYSKNSYSGAEFAKAQANASMGMATQGSISARGTMGGGQPPGPVDTSTARGG